MLIKTAGIPAHILSVIRDRGTEYPFSGVYDDFSAPGTYLCRQCGVALFRAESKFSAHCGWPSFDEAVNAAVRYSPDPDGRRTEISCARCGAHLGHVFEGEKWTPTNQRFCVNSVSLDFVLDQSVLDTQEAIVAGGCFWGVEYYLQRLPGVLKTQVGYTGGHVDNPTYEAVCTGRTGHVEAVRVLYDPSRVTYEQILRLFLEIHDPTQRDGQGPDRGPQYLSVIFCYDDTQEKTAARLLGQLSQRDFNVVTRICPVSAFWPAEAYHQQYYENNKKWPYCHQYVKRFED